jgi:hypothetical protein
LKKVVRANVNHVNTLHTGCKDISFRVLLQDIGQV